METRDVIALIDAFDARWNAHDLEGVLSYFTEDSVVRFVPPPPDGGVYTGLAQIRGFVQTHLPGFHVEARNHRISGEKVTWDATASADSFRQMGLDQADGTAEAIIQDGKVKSFTYTLSPETVARLQAAMAAAQQRGG